ncbi:MAG TPA: Hpt domain-containing protein, partial [Rubrivivax sp.]|nr:Hpt domain-containing protein [Rubrivivax sp.]
MNMLHDLAALADLADPADPAHPGDGADAAHDDLSTLAWVHDELRRSLEAAHKALRRHLKEAQSLSGSDVDAVDPAVLRGARAQLHQAIGALQMVGLPGPARVLQASEAAVQRFIARPKLLTREAFAAVEAASFGVLDYLGRKLAGKGLPTLALFPQYRALQEWAGADRVHPADLWREERPWLPLGLPASAAPIAADAGARSAMETLVLATMRGADDAALQRLSELCAGLGAGGGERPAELWKLAAAFYEAQACGLLQADVYAKRLGSRLLAQLRLAIGGQGEVSDRLAQDVLFFCAQAGEPAAAAAAPRLQAVRERYGLQAAAAFDYQAASLGRFDPAWTAQARKRVAAAKDAWSAVAGGDTPFAASLGEPFALVGDSLKRLYASGELLADALQAAIAQTQAAAQPPRPALAMEVATSVLYVEASLEDGDFDHPQTGTRMRRLAQRIREAANGGAPQPLEPWMEELYRRVSDRQTMGSVVHELRSALSEVEKQIDQYFRDPAQRALLIPVPAQLQAMRGVLSVLDIEQASHAVRRMSEDVDALAATDIDPQHAAELGTFTRLADNLGALSFMIDMLSVQPRMARSLFRWDPASGSLSAVMGRRSARLSGFGELDAPQGAAAPRLVDQARSLARAAAEPGVADDTLQRELARLSQQALLADQRALAQSMASAQQALQRASGGAQREQARSELARSVADLSAPAEPLPLPLPPARITPEPQAQQPGSTGLEEDAEMRDVFIEEAREVVDGAAQALQRLAHSSDALADMTLIRRAFHTLKGSSRMVGLKPFGEAAWSCEQLYNARLADSACVDAELAG